MRMRQPLGSHYHVTEEPEAQEAASQPELEPSVSGCGGHGLAITRATFQGQGCPVCVPV